jgi:hypothetical protein
LLIRRGIGKLRPLIYQWLIWVCGLCITVHGEQTGGFKSAGHAQIAHSHAQALIHRMRGNSKGSGDFLGGKMQHDKPQTFTLTFAQAFQIMGRPQGISHGSQAPHFCSYGAARRAPTQRALYHQSPKFAKRIKRSA